MSIAVVRKQTPVVANNLLEAIDKIKNFVGESVPVIESNQRMLGVITESDLFNELVSAENSRKKEELSD